MARPTSYMTDLRHLLDEHGDPVRGPAGGLGQYVGLVVELGSRMPVGRGGGVAMLCANPARRRRCGDRLWVQRTSADQVEWDCGRCAEQGVVHGWRGSRFDLGGVPASRGVDGGAGGAVLLQELDAMRRLGGGSPALRRVMVEVVDVGEGYFMLSATYAELVELGGLAATAAECARGRDRRLLDRFGGRVDALRTTMSEFFEVPEEPLDLEAVRRAGTPAEVIAIAREIAVADGRDDVEVEDLLAAQEAWSAGRRPLLH